jgi:hypothetical protein
MTKAALHSRAKSVTAGLIINFLLSWTVLPLAIPPFRVYSFRELMEVLLWQGMGAVGWPFAILGGFASLILQGTMSGLTNLLLVLIYPTMLLVLIFVLFSKRSKQWVLIILHMLITFAFAAIWYQVLNGYEFMPG